jgi:hypothetical protein
MSEETPQYKLLNESKVLTIEMPIVWVPWSTLDNVVAFQIWSALENVPINTPIKVLDYGRVREGEEIPGAGGKRFLTANVTAQVIVPLDWKPTMATSSWSQPAW